jgi:hypothetical protein
MPERVVAFIVLGLVGLLGTLSLLVPADRTVVSGLLIATFGVGSVAVALWMSIRTKPAQWIPTVAWTTLLILAFFIVGAALDWIKDAPMDPDYKPGLAKKPPVFIFCEGYTKTWIQQPISTWTDLAFVLSGLGLMLIASLRSGPSSDGNPADPPILRTGSWIPFLYSAVVVYMGPGSMYFHASLKSWAGWCDAFSISNWAAFGLGYTTWRLCHTHPRVGDNCWPLLVVWLGVAIPAGILSAVTGDGRTVLMICVALWVLMELVLMSMVGVAWIRKQPDPLQIHRNGWWLLACTLAFLAAFGCWIPSGGVTRIWCNPDAASQGHGFWHIFAASGTFIVFGLWGSERPRAA